MSSVSPAHAAAATAAVASTTSTEAPKRAEAPKSAAAPQVSSGPAATVQLSQKAQAMLKGDKDWQPGMNIDSF